MSQRDISPGAEHTFTAGEIQEAIEAVILYERARTERLLRSVADGLMTVALANRRQVHRGRHQTIDEIIGNLDA